MRHVEALPQTPHNRISKQVTSVSICVHNLYDIAVHFRSVGRLHLRSVIPRTYSLWTRRIDANDRSGNVGREKLARRVFRTAGEGLSPRREAPSNAVFELDVPIGSQWFGQAGL